MNKINEQIRKLRKKRGLSQVELGKLTNVSQQVITNYERGIREPNIDMLIKISSALKVSVDQLIGTKPAKVAEEQIPRILKKRFEKVNEMPKEKQKAFISMVDALAS